MRKAGVDWQLVAYGGAVHTSGKGYTDWGGGIGFNFVGADALTLLDASAYTGLSFKLSGSTPVHIGLATKATWSMPGIATSAAYRAAPVTLSRPSTRYSGSPRTEAVRSATFVTGRKPGAPGTRRSRA